jgi:hypothetical protein
LVVRQRLQRRDPSLPDEVGGIVAQVHAHRRILVDIDEVKYVEAVAPDVPVPHARHWQRHGDAVRDTRTQLVVGLGCALPEEGV